MRLPPLNPAKSIADWNAWAYQPKHRKRLPATVNETPTKTIWESDGSDGETLLITMPPKD